MCVYVYKPELRRMLGGQWVCESKASSVEWSGNWGGGEVGERVLGRGGGTGVKEKEDLAGC